MNEEFCEGIKQKYIYNCNPYIIKEILNCEMKIICLFSAAGLYYFTKSNTFSKLIIYTTYKTILGLTKIQGVFNKVKNYFDSNSSETTNKKKYIFDEVKVIKDGIRCATFETLLDLKESSYLGNPLEYCDIDTGDIDTDTDADVTSIVSSNSDENHNNNDSDNSDSDNDENGDNGVNEENGVNDENGVNGSSDPLFIMEKNESDNTLEFRKYDFIMNTVYYYGSDYKLQDKNYTRIFRTFTENEYENGGKKYEISNAEMIICSLELENGKIFEIDVSSPYNFNVVGNVILDEKFIKWYMIKNYNTVLTNSENYKVTCITKYITTFKLDRSSGLRVNLNNYTFEIML